MLITADYLRLHRILNEMVAANQLTISEKEELLHKSGLIKLENNRWKEPDGPILHFNWNKYFLYTIRNWKDIKVILSIKHLLNNLKELWQILTFLT